MIVTRKELAQNLTDYLFHRIKFNDLVNWAELAIMEAEFEDQHFELIKEVLMRLGVADVRAFGITWEDCEEVLFKLGYRVNLTITECATAA